MDVRIGIRLVRDNFGEQIRVSEAQLTHHPRVTRFPFVLRTTEGSYRTAHIHRETCPFVSATVPQGGNLPGCFDDTLVHNRNAHFTRIVIDMAMLSFNLEARAVHI